MSYHRKYQSSPKFFTPSLLGCFQHGRSFTFLSCFFSVFKKETGNRKLKLIEGSKKQARIRNSAALPEEINHQFSLAEIKDATNNFHEDLIIGKGGFGPVYKGFFNDRNLVVAVKRLELDSSQGCLEFQTEALLLCQLHHQHLVHLRGFCNDKDEMILVFEYMRNRTLQDHLHGFFGNDPLPWKQRLEICIGVARGLHYLHTGAKQAIIHRDVKSSNILLDDKWVCKLSDFGLSKLRSRGKSKTLEKIFSRVLGTYGYADPEYVQSGELTEKSDVYSFGVLLFEVLCAKKVIDRNSNGHQVLLVDWARWSIGEGTIYSIIDPYLKGRIAPECFKIFVDISFSCTSGKGNTRPEMGEVEVMLERALELQQKADADMMHLAPNGEYMYEEVSFCACDSKYKSIIDSYSVGDYCGVSFESLDA